MIIKNPTNKEITVTYKGTKFSCEAEGTTNVKAVVAEFWKGIHGFISVLEGPKTTSTGGEESNDDSTTSEVGKESEDKNEDENKNGDEDGELDLDSLSRTELDAVAVELELDPSEYKNMAEIIEAIKSQE